MEVVPQLVELLCSLLSGLLKHDQDAGGCDSIMMISLKCEIYDVLNTLSNSFIKSFKKNSQELLNIVLPDLNIMKSIYVPLITTQQPLTINELAQIFKDLPQFEKFQIERREPVDDVIKKTVSVQISFLQSLLELHTLPQDINSWSELLGILIQLSIIPRETQSEYKDDFNGFVTDETGLSVDVSIRESVIEFLNDLNTEENANTIGIMAQKLNESTKNNSNTDNKQLNPIEIEAISFMLNACFSNDEVSSTPTSFQLLDFLNYLMDQINNIFTQLRSAPPPTTDEDEAVSFAWQLVAARYILMVPNFILKYESELKQYGVPSLKQILTHLSNIQKVGDNGNDSFQILKCAMLISFQYFNHFIRAREFDHEIQFALIGLINQLKDESDEDTNIMMLESLTILICIDNKALCSGLQSQQQGFGGVAGTGTGGVVGSGDKSSVDVLMLILEIGFKDCQNFSLNTSTLECVEDLLRVLPMDSYLRLCYSGLPKLLNVLESFGSPGNGTGNGDCC
ncbi:unnamed protein product [Ambrosiozyma monospora]|uniref:Unnamed protein product n=1 Tax=Ambrosiozyma monospora TaxID=43982 RepID=A0ACB5TAQ8_AMBMO|nr:unnamed protein product [Ambrosiozyma monospora]